MMRTEKEGFEPSRRVTDLHPFQGCPFSLLGTSPNVSLRYDTLASVIFPYSALRKTKALIYVSALEAERMGFEPMRP